MCQNRKILIFYHFTGGPVNNMKKKIDQRNIRRQSDKHLFLFKTRILPTTQLEYLRKASKLPVSKLSCVGILR